MRSAVAILATILAFAGSISANATTLSYSKFVTGNSAAFQQDLVEPHFTAFDASLGTLVSAEARFVGSFASAAYHLSLINPADTLPKTVTVSQFASLSAVAVAGFSKSVALPVLTLPVVNGNVLVPAVNFELITNVPTAANFVNDPSIRLNAFELVKSADSGSFFNPNSETFDRTSVSGTITLTYTYTPVPEPVSASILGIGLIGLVARRRKRAQS